MRCSFNIVQGLNINVRFAFVLFLPFLLTVVSCSLYHVIELVIKRLRPSLTLLIHFVAADKLGDLQCVR